MPATPYKYALVTHTIYIGTHRTCIRLDNVTWEATREVQLREGLTPNEFYTRVMNWKPKELSFTVAVRQYLMLYFRAATTEDGHAEAGHGAIVIRLPAAHRAPARAA